MGWLSDRIIQYIFSNGEDELIIEAKASDPEPEPPKGYKYKGFVPEKNNLMTRVRYDQNGRVAYRIDVGGGKQIHRSATREHYEHMIGNTGSAKIAEAKRQGYKMGSNESQYTKAYGEKVKAAEKQRMETKNREFKKILKGVK